MITLNKRFKTPVRKIFPRFIVCRRLRTQGRCRKLLRLCWPRYTPFRVCCITFQCFDIRLKNSFRYITFRCLDIRWKHPFSCLLYYFSVFGYRMTHSFSCLLYYILVFGYQMKTPLLVFVILLFSVWISDETLILVFVILHLGVWISDKTPLLVFVILLFGYRCLKIKWNTFLGAWMSRV